MALKQIRIGNIADAFQYDDTEYDTAIEVSEPIRINAAPVDAKDVLRLEDIGLVIYPINSVFISVVSTNPNTLLGFGTWVAIATGQFLVGYKAADPDFAPVENTGGAKTHTHDVDVPSTTSEAEYTTTVLNLSAATTTLVIGTDLASIDMEIVLLSSLGVSILGQMTGGIAGQIKIFVFQDNAVSVKDGVKSDGKFYLNQLPALTDFDAAQDDTLAVINVGGDGSAINGYWKEFNRQLSVK